MKKTGWLLALFCILVSASAQAQYPNKAIRILVPYAPGGLTDVVARLYAEQVRKDLGQQVVIENKPGASGIIAIEQMTHNFPPKTFAEFVDYARAHPGVVRYASAGVGAYQHVNTEIIAKRLGGLKLLHIPYKDGGPGILKDLSNGDVQVSWFNITNPVGMMQAGHVRPLAISAPQRLPAYPDVPTIDEVGLPGVRATQWTAAFAPSGVPRDIVEALHKAFVKAQAAPELKAAFEKGGMNMPQQSSVADAQAWLKEEMAALARDIKDAGITADQP
jgi:tripartite-type tricarboxylate transporter receptor subunit TctC